MKKIVTILIILGIIAIGTLSIASTGSAGDLPNCGGYYLKDTVPLFPGSDIMVEKEIYCPPPPYLKISITI